MLFLIMAILGSSALAILMRFSEGRVRSQTSMLAVNYITCMALCGAYMKFDLALGTEKSGITIGLGIITGIFYVVALLLMQVNIRKNGVILPSVFSRLGGLLVPLALAICFFGEVPSAAQIAGAIVAGLAIVALSSGGGISSLTSIFSLLWLLVLDGFAAGMSTVYEQLGTTALSTQFLFYTFGTAFLYCVVLIIKNREGLGWPEILCGLAIGIPNFFASRCMLKALETIPAVIVYPTRGVGCLLVVTLAGVLLFGERLKKHQWAAVAAVLVAVVLLNI